MQERAQQWLESSLRRHSEAIRQHTQLHTIRCGMQTVGVAALSTATAVSSLQTLLELDAAVVHVSVRDDPRPSPAVHRDRTALTGAAHMRILRVLCSIRSSTGVLALCCVR